MSLAGRTPADQGLQMIRCSGSARVSGLDWSGLVLILDEMLGAGPASAFLCCLGQWASCLLQTEM